MSGKLRIRCTAQQVKLLTKYMAIHPRLARGDFSGPQGRLSESQQWKELRTMLSQHGPDKSIDKWKVTWRDLRRKAHSEGRRATNSTGNVTVVPFQKIGILGTEGAFRMLGCEESGIGSTPTLSGTPQTPDPLEVIDISFDEIETLNTLNETQALHTIGKVSEQDPSQQRAAEQQQQLSQVQTARTAQDARARTLTTRNERLQRQRRQYLRSRATQFLEAELQTNNTLKEVVNQLAIANTHSAIRSRLTYKEKLWQLRKDLFK